MTLAQGLASLAGFAALIASASYAALSLFGVVAWRRQRRGDVQTNHPPVTILKPLCGAEPGLYADLLSFCRQDYPDFEIVFGIRDEADPACLVARRLAAEFPALPISVVVNPQLHGSNRKVSNLINMLPYARHEILVMADSDALVEPGYLRTATAPLREARVGLVTCLYRGMPTAGIWSRIGAMYINEWYVPSVLVAWFFGHRGYVSGQTVCMRHETLIKIGGLTAIANHLADDYRLGELVRALGLRIALSPYLVSGEYHEPTLDSMTRHELRWMRTLKVLRPASFRWLFLTFTLPLAVLGFVLVFFQYPESAVAKVLLAAAFVLRLTLHFVHRIGSRRALFSDLWLLPVRDYLIWWVWFLCFFTSRVTWRGHDFAVDADGVMHPLS
jgi:ceramide glucosyltransferase